MIKKYAGAMLVCMITAGSPVLADELGDAAQALCEKMKSCALAQMEGQDLTPQARQMMQPMLDGMCTDVRAKVGDVPSGHPLYDPAVSCMQSMNSMSCESMQNAAQAVTPECEEYEQLARESGEDA